MKDEPKVIARIAPIGLMPHLREEKQPTSVLEYVVYRGIMVWSRWRKQCEIDVMLKSITWVDQHVWYLPGYINEFWCDSNAGCYNIELHPPTTREAYYTELLRQIGETFSKALIEYDGGHNGICVKIGTLEYVVDPWWDEDRIFGQPETE